jgi:hypothetical protein
MLRDGLIGFADAKIVVRKAVEEKLNLANVIEGSKLKAGQRNRLGEMLTEAGLLCKEQLNFCLTIAKNSGMPLGQILVLLHRISESALRFALALQGEVRARSISRSQAIEKLKRIEFNCETADHIRALRPYKIKLGRLLLFARLIDNDLLILLVKNARRSHKLLGQAIVDRGVLSLEELNLALWLQKMVWQGTMSYASAARLLKTACHYQRMKDESAPALSVNGRYELSFYDFLRVSGYLSDDTVKTLVATIRSDTRMMNLATGSATVESMSHDKFADDDIVHALRNTALLRFALSRAMPQEQHLVNCGLMLFIMCTAQGISVAQALVNFGVEWNSRTTCGAPA